MKEKIRRLRLCIEYIEFLNDEPQTTHKCTKVLHHLAKWRSSLHKALQQHRAELRIKSRADVGCANNPNNFLNCKQIKEDIQQAFASDIITPKQHTLIISFIAAKIIYGNSQRPGVVQNMNTDEYLNNEEESSGKYRISVVHHKTSSTSGAAELVIDEETNNMITNYLENVRRHASPKSSVLSKRLFLTHTGNEFRKITESIQYVANDYGYQVPSATLNRKVTATAAREYLNQRDALAIHTHMSHAPETSMRSYQFPDVNDSVDTHGKIQVLQGKKYFSQNEDNIILKEWPLTIKMTPPLKNCRAIILKHELNRTAKQVQDRWKTLQKNNK